MAYEDGVNLNMPVAPAYGNSGFGGFGGENGWWIILHGRHGEDVRLRYETS